MARQLTGTVTSDKGDKTIVITVRARKTHPLYKKQYTVNTKFMAHDEKNEAKVGDLVMITETRPISARKHFRLTKIVEQAGAAFAETDATADVAEDAIAPKAEKPVKIEKPAKRETPAKDEETKQ
ncbi:30S ribosomal protein S17 [Candidatus Saccharibacteria bacterium]|nr:30S ribosomal protein S17 [Candidatus Saccharibacteria bacterium]